MLSQENGLQVTIVLLKIVDDLFHGCRNINLLCKGSRRHCRFQLKKTLEEHVADIKFLTTLAGYIHWQLTGEKVLGIGDASGMIPIDPATKQYSAEMVKKFDDLVAGVCSTSFPKCCWLARKQASSPRRAPSCSTYLAN